jgi:hypothetical protein
MGRMADWSTMSVSMPALAILALLSAQSAAAPPAQPGLADVVAPGLKVSIVDDRGVEIDGRVEAVTDHAVRLAVRNGTREIPIEQIVRIARPDGIKNGALVGLGIGVTLGGVSGVLTELNSEGSDVGFIAASIFGNGLVCAGIGALIDAAIDGRETLYERGRHARTRVTPVIDKGVRGVSVSLTW